MRCTGHSPGLSGAINWSSVKPGSSSSRITWRFFFFNGLVSFGMTEQMRVWPLPLQEFLDRKIARFTRDGYFSLP